MDAYFQAISEYSATTAAEEGRYARWLRAGVLAKARLQTAPKSRLAVLKKLIDRGAAGRDALICGMLRYAVKLAHKHAGGDQTKLEDLIQEGNMALLRATKTFDPRKGRWSTYAHQWITQHILRYLDQDRLIQVPICNLHVRPPNAKIAMATDLATAPLTSLSGKLPHVGHRWVGVPGNRTANDWVEEDHSRYLSTLAAQATEYLSERELAVLRSRYQGRTLEEIGIEIGVTRERVRQISNAVTTKLGDITTAIRYGMELPYDRATDHNAAGDVLGNPSEGARSCRRYAS